MRWLTITGIETNGPLGYLGRQLIEELTQMIGRTRRERRGVRTQLQALAVDHLVEEQLQLARDAKLMRRSCGAHARSTGQPCRAPAMPNGRCKLHGGLSTGAKTPEGRQRISEAQRRRWNRWREKQA